MSATPALLALVSAVGYGTGDFLGGEGSRRTSPAQMSLLVQSAGLVVAVIAVAITTHGFPPTRVIGWGAVSGAGSALGNQALYRGLAGGAMNVVAPVSAVLTATLPAVVGLAGGNHLGLPGAAGLVIALPAIALVSFSPGHALSRSAGGLFASSQPAANSLLQDGVGWGLLAGCGFGLLFVGLDKAGTRSGAWPLLFDQVVAVSLVGAVNLCTHSQTVSAIHRSPWSHALPWGFASGLSGAAGNIFFFVATASGPLTVVAVLSALYPAVTVVLAAIVLREKTSPPQLFGLAVAALAISLITSS